MQSPQSATTPRRLTLGTNILLTCKNPGSRATSVLTSVKAEPGSALESNASISLSLQADKMVSPDGFITGKSLSEATILASNP